MRLSLVSVTLCVLFVSACKTAGGDPSALRSDDGLTMQSPAEMPSSISSTPGFEDAPQSKRSSILRMRDMQALGCVCVQNVNSKLDAAAAKQEPWALAAFFTDDKRGFRILVTSPLPLAQCIAAEKQDKPDCSKGGAS